MYLIQFRLQFFLLIFTFIHEIVIIKATRLLGGFASMLHGNFFSLKMTKIMINCSHVQWCSGGGATGAIAPVHLFQGGAPLQFLFHLFLVNFAYIVQKLIFDLNYYWQTIPNHMQYTFKYFLGL